jgi:hypothetical protein
MKRGPLLAVFLLLGLVATARAERARDITFDDVKFDIEKGAPFDAKMLTDKIRELNGKPIRVRGYMLPSFQQTGIRQFILVRDNQECCFGPKAALYDCMVVDMAGGATTDFSVVPITIEGTFSFREVKAPDGSYHLAIYHLDASSVK